MILIVPAVITIILAFLYHQSKKELQFLIDFRKEKDTDFDKPKSGDVKELIQWSHSSQKRRGRFTFLFQRLFSIFANQETIFKKYLKHSKFISLFDEYLSWVIEIYSKKCKNFKVLLRLAIITFITIVITYYLFYPEVNNLEPFRIYEIFFTYIHIIVITMIYYIEVIPFLRTKKVNRSITELSSRSTNDFYHRLIYNSLFILGLVGYIISIQFFDIPFQLDVFISFIHVLLIGQFTDRLVEKGSPLEPSIKVNKTLNLNILHSMQLRIVTITVFLLYNQVNSINFFLDKSEIDNSGRGIFIIYILVIVFTHFIKSQKQKKKLTNQFGQEFLNYIKSNEQSTNAN